MLKLKVQGKYILFIVGLSLATILSCTSVYLFLLKKQSDELFEQLSQQTVSTFEKTIVSQAEQMSEYLAAALFDPLYSFNPDQAAFVLEPLLEVKHINKIVVFDSEELIFHDGSKLLLNFGQKFSKQDVLDTVLIQREDYNEFEENRFKSAKPIMVNNNVIGGLYIEFSLGELNSNISHMSDVLESIATDYKKKLILSISAVIIIIFIFSILLAILIARSVSGPISRLIDYTKVIAAADFSAANKLLCTKRTDEFGELARAFSDMSLQLEIKTQKITFQAYHDSLTGLPNRLHFMEHINQWKKYNNQTPFTILFIDLDNFKAINDNYSHDKGNYFLQQIAIRLTKTLGAQNCPETYPHKENCRMVARVGGDEFLVYLPFIYKQQDILPLVSQLFSAIRSPIQLNNDQIVVSGSIGISTYPETSHSTEELIKYADMAMYQAKDDGKNTYKFFNSSMNEEVIQKALIERELRKALTDLSQFEFWYQPQIDLQTQKIIGAEALVRWRHPRMGLISPDEFIPVAEATGMIVPIGNWLIQLLCEKLSQWQPRIDKDFHIAFNLSAIQIYRSDVVRHIKQCLKKYDISPENLNVEITESLLLKNEKQAQHILTNLRKTGLKVWLDDFGTGYSSLAYLRKFELDGIKVDRSFINELTTTQRDQKLVTAMIALANKLNLQVIAEGIESHEQLGYLKQYECKYGQGYYFSKPLPAEEFETELTK